MVRAMLYEKTLVEKDKPNLLVRITGPPYFGGDLHTYTHTRTHYRQITKSSKLLRSQCVPSRGSRVKSTHASKDPIRNTRVKACCALLGIDNVLFARS